MATRAWSASPLISVKLHFRSKSSTSVSRDKDRYFGDENGNLDNKIYRKNGEGQNGVESDAYIIKRPSSVTLSTKKHDRNNVFWSNNTSRNSSQNEPAFPGDNGFENKKGNMCDHMRSDCEGDEKRFIFAKPFTFNNFERRMLKIEESTMETPNDSCKTQSYGNENHEFVEDMNNEKVSMSPQKGIHINVGVNADDMYVREDSMFGSPKSLSSTVVFFDQSSVRLTATNSPQLPSLLGVLNDSELDKFGVRVRLNVLSIYGDKTVGTYGFKLFRVEGSDGMILAEKRGEGKLFDINKPIDLVCDSLDDIDHVVYTPISGRKRDVVHSIKDVRLEIGKGLIYDTYEWRLPLGMITHINMTTNPPKVVESANECLFIPIKITEMETKRISCETTHLHNQPDILRMNQFGVDPKMTNLHSCHVLKFVVLSFHCDKGTGHAPTDTGSRWNIAGVSKLCNQAYLNALPTFTGLSYFQTLPYLESNIRSIDIFPNCVKPFQGGEWQYMIKDGSCINTTGSHRYRGSKGVITVTFKSIQPVTKLALKNHSNRGVKEFLVLLDECVIHLGILPNNGQLVMLSL